MGIPYQTLLVAIQFVWTFCTHRQWGRKKHPARALVFRGGGYIKTFILLAHVCADHIVYVDEGKSQVKRLFNSTILRLSTANFPTGAERTKTSNTIDIVRPSWKLVNLPSFFSYSLVSCFTCRSYFDLTSPVIALITLFCPPDYKELASWVWNIRWIVKTSLYHITKVGQRSVIWVPRSLLSSLPLTIWWRIASAQSGTYMYL